VLFGGVPAAAVVEAAQVWGGDPGSAGLPVDVAEREPDQQPLPGPLTEPVGASA
jgi:hypothetical protein